MILPFFIVFSLLAASSYALVDAGNRGSQGIKIGVAENPQAKQSKKEETLTRDATEEFVKYLLGEGWTENQESERIAKSGRPYETHKTPTTPSTAAVNSPNSAGISPDTTSGGTQQGEQPLAVLTPPSPSSVSPQGTGNSAQNNKEIEKRIAKEREEFLKRWQTVASRVKMNQEERELFRRTLQETWPQIESYWEQFKNSPQTEYDKKLLRENISYTYQMAMEDLKRSLGDETFKRIMAENRYYDKPEERMVDIQRKVNEMDKQMDQQEKQLKTMERTLRNPPARSNPSPKSGTSPNIPSRSPFRRR